MSKMPLAAGLAATLLVGGPAFAQDRQGQFITEQPHTSLRLSKLKGVDVIGQDHTKLGDIEEVLIDRDDVDVMSFQIAGNVYKALEDAKEAGKMYRKALK